MNERFRLSLFLTVCGVAASGGSAAQAQPEVVERLVKHGELSEAQAKVLVKAVSKRMQRAASPHARKDKVGVSVARALHERNATSHRGRQRVVIRLRAGLDMWALKHLFSPGASSMANCGEQFKLSANLCGSLAAASSAGSEQAEAQRDRPASVAPTAAVPEIEKVAARPRPPTARELAAQRRADAAAERRLASDRKREAVLAKRERARQSRLLAQQHKRDLATARAEAKRERLDAERQKHADAAAAQAKREQEKRDAILQQRELVAAARAKQERDRQEAIQRKRDEAERVERERREAIQAERDRVEVARRKAEYQKQRDAYLERQRQELTARKERAVATSAGEKVQRGPASRLEAQLIGLAPEAAEPKPGSDKAHSASAKGKPSTDLPNGLDMVDDLVAEPSSKRVAHR